MSARSRRRRRFGRNTNFYFLRNNIFNFVPNLLFRIEEEDEPEILGEEDPSEYKKLPCSFCHMFSNNIVLFFL